MRKCLLLTYHFPPSSAAAVYRMLGLVRYLPKYGWQPVVVAPSHVPWEPEDPALLAQVPPETPVERVPLVEGMFRKVIRRLGPESHWIVKALPACRRMIRAHRPEVIITSSPPGCLHVLALWLQWWYRLPWIACFRDPWVTNRPPRNPTFWQRCDGWWEKRVMKRATWLIANTLLNQQGWQAAFPQAGSRIVTITNGFDPDNFEPLKTPRARRDQLTILHAGELYAGRDPRPFLQALQQVVTGPATERLPLVVDIVGRKTEAIFDFPTELRKYGLENCVRLHDQVPYAEALKRMMDADILLLLQMPGFRIGVPGKLYEYLGAGRPILALAEADGDIAWVLRESKVLHRTAPPSDTARIKQALIELTREVQQGHIAVPDPSALQQFTRERMAQRFAECLDRCVEPDRLLVSRPLAPVVPS